MLTMVVANYGDGFGLCAQASLLSQQTSLEEALSAAAAQSQQASDCAGRAAELQQELASVQSQLERALQEVLRAR